MVSTKTLVVHLTIVLAVLICSLDSTTANAQCKSRVMNIVMRQCSGFGGMRRRRGLPKIETNTGKVIRSSQYRNPVKRQLSVNPTGVIASMAGPAMHDMITGAISGARRDYQSHLAGQFAGTPKANAFAIAPVPRWYPGSPQCYVAVSDPSPSPSLFHEPESLVKGFISQGSGDDLGFDLTTDEVEEVYFEISNRISRNSGKSPAEIKRDIIQAAAKCCQNEELCLKEQSIIPCV